MLYANEQGEVLGKQAAWEQFITSEKGFVCEFARQALHARRINFVELPDHRIGYHDAQSNIEIASVGDRCNALYEGIRPIRDKQSDAVIFLESQNPRSHTEGYRRAWEFMAQLHLAASKYAVPFLDFNAPATQQGLSEYAEYFSDVENMHEFQQGNAPQLDDEILFMITMNPLYPSAPTMHPRYGPNSAYVVTRLSDIQNITLHARNSPAAIQTRKRARQAEFPYEGTLPYVMDDDPRHRHEVYWVMRSLAARLLETAGVTGDLDTGTRALLKFSADLDGGVLENQQRTMDAMWRALIKAGWRVI